MAAARSRPGLTSRTWLCSFDRNDRTASPRRGRTREQRGGLPRPTVNSQSKYCKPGRAGARPVLRSVRGETLRCPREGRTACVCRRVAGGLPFEEGEGGQGGYGELCDAHGCVAGLVVVLGECGMRVECHHTEDHERAGDRGHTTMARDSPVDVGDPHHAEGILALSAAIKHLRRSLFQPVSGTCLGGRSERRARRRSRRRGCS